MKKKKAKDAIAKVKNDEAEIKAETRVKIDKDVEDQANEYFPVQSDSEKAAGHPIVGVS